ncbi:MAG: sugar phosphate isomerase/epimerase [Ruminococcaceae bacterium]|nr:sugar phosphate isomerase/epimerase [Oscillospiraceae bacterium]
MAFKVAVQLYSVRGEVAKDMRATLEKVKAMGYDGVEFAGIGNHSAAEIKSMCEEIGLVPISAHVTFADMRKEPKAALAVYSDIGCKYVAVPYLTPEDRPGTDGFAKTIEDVAMIGKVAKKMGMQLLYHNHDFEFIKLDGKYALDILYDAIPAEDLKTELDVCWVRVGGEEPASYIRKYTGRAPVVHLKDYFGEKSESMYELIGIKPTAPTRPSNFEYRPVGSGLQDFPTILDAAKDAGTEWLVVEQDNPSMGLTPMECIEKSRKYLRSIGC